MDAKAGKKYRLIVNVPGYGYAGDIVEVIRTSGELCHVKIGSKQFCIERINLGICQVLQQQVRLT